MSKHTPGPWNVGSHGHILKDKNTFDFVRIASPYRDGAFESDPVAIANAARIVACVNALEGIEDPAEFVRQAKMFMAEQYSQSALGDGLEGEFE